MFLSDGHLWPMDPRPCFSTLPLWERVELREWLESMVLGQ